MPAIILTRRMQPSNSRATVTQPCMKRLRWFALAAMVIALWIVPTVAASVVTYLTNRRLSPGQGSVTSGYAPRTYQEVSFDNPYGGLPQMGTSYIYQGGQSTWKWSNTGYLFDSRDNGYARGACKANSGNNYDVWVYYCTTDNSS